MRLVDDDGDWLEIEGLNPDEVLDIVLRHEAKISELQERISTLESEVEYYKHEAARAPWYIT